MEALRAYLNSLPVRDQKAYAVRCGTSLGYLRKALSVHPAPRFDVALASALDRYSGGQVPRRVLLPEADWDLILGIAPSEQAEQDEAA